MSDTNSSDANTKSETVTLDPTTTPYSLEDQLHELQRQRTLLLRMMDELARHGGYFKYLDLKNLFYDGEEFIYDGPGVIWMDETPEFSFDPEFVFTPEPQDHSSKINQLFDDLYRFLLKIKALGATVLDLSITKVITVDGHYRYPDQFIVPITPGLQIRNYDKTFRIFSDLKGYIIFLDKLNLCLNYFDPQEIIYTDGVYMITPTHPATSEKVTGGYLPRQRKFFPFSYYAPNDFQLITPELIWEDIKNYLGIRGWRVSYWGNLEFSLGYSDPKHNIYGMSKSYLPDWRYISISELLIQRGTKEFIPLKVLQVNENYLQIQGTLEGRPRVAIITSKHRQYNPNIDDSGISLPELAQYDIQGHYSVYYRGEKLNVVCNVREELTPVLATKVDISTLAANLIYSLFLIHDQKLVHTGITPEAVVMKSQRYYLDNLNYIQKKNYFRHYFSPEFSLFGSYQQGRIFNSYRNDLIELGYTLNYFATGKVEAARFRSPDQRINDYLKYLFTLESDVKPTLKLYRKLLKFFTRQKIL